MSERNTDANSVTDSLEFAKPVKFNGNFWYFKT